MSWSNPDGPRGVLGYAEVTSDQGSITSETDLTGLSVTVTAPANRRVKVTGVVKGNNSAGSQSVVRLYEDSTVVQLVRHEHTGEFGSDRQFTFIPMAPTTPSAASHTYKLTGEAVQGTFVAEADAGGTGVTDEGPNWILVEDIGPA